jgi:hypothetical protein
LNKNRLNRLEKSVGKQLQEEREAPAVWRPEGGRMAIQESPFILERLRSLNREVVYSPYVFTTIKRTERVFFISRQKRGIKKIK